MLSIQGYPGSFHHIAARHFFPEENAMLNRDSFQEVFSDVENGRAEYGIVAIENSIAGSLLENYDLLLRKNLSVIGELYLHVSQNLIGFHDTDPEQVHQVHSHPMALKQSEEFLSQYPNWSLCEERDTAYSVELVKETGDRHSVAIGSKLAAEIHGMKILAADIESVKTNYTRFFVLGREPLKSEKCTKTSLVCSVPNTPGSLYKLMKLIAEANINLSKIESRPIPEKLWSYYFYIDFEAGIQEDRVWKLLEKIKQMSTFYKLLGSYPGGEYVREE